MPTIQASRTIRTIVVDDEPLARSNLRILLARDPDVMVVVECGTGEEAVAAIRTQRPDLVFLDVQMPEVDGFDVLERLGAQLPPAVVFVTAYDLYALRAFDAGALDYLLKPFDDARFGLSLARAKAQVAMVRAAAQPAGRLVVRNGRALSVVAVADIDWIESADYCVALHTGPRTHLLRRSLDSIAEELDAWGFCRVHRSAVVHLDRVSSLACGPDGADEIVLSTGARVPVSRRYRERVIARLAHRA